MLHTESLMRARTRRSFEGVFRLARSLHSRRALKASRAFMLVVALLVAGACGRRDAAVTVAQLLGRWEVELYSPEVPADSVHGMIVLDSIARPSAACLRSGLPCHETVRGVHEVNFRPLLGHQLSTEVDAGVDDVDGKVVVMIGECCDRGELALKGGMRNGVIRGGWEETFIGGGRSGSFVLHKVSNDGLPVTSQ